MKQCERGPGRMRSKHPGVECRRGIFPMGLLSRRSRTAEKGHEGTGYDYHHLFSRPSELAPTPLSLCLHCISQMQGLRPSRLEMTSSRILLNDGIAPRPCEIVDSVSVHLGWGLRVCISNKLSGHVHGVVDGFHFEEQRLEPFLPVPAYCNPWRSFINSWGLGLTL